jgi:aminopeptidase YwaD
MFAGDGKRALGIHFIAFGAEEYGRHLRALGSVEYVRRHPAETRDTRAVVQADGIGAAAGDTRAHLMGWTGYQKEGLFAILRRFPRCIADDKVELGSDHVPFYQNGIPAALFTGEAARVFIHTAQDTIALMSLDELAFSTEVIAALLQHLSSGQAAGIS